jgi:hypothetical protein
MNEVRGSNFNTKCSSGGDRFFGQRFHRRTMVLMSFFRSLLQIVAALVLVAAFTLSSRAQSQKFDDPIPMSANTAEGILPTGKPTSHYYSFTAGPGEVIMTFVFSTNGNPNSAYVGGQLTDQYGRAMTNLDASLGTANPKEVTGAIFPGELTLAGRFSNPRRQKLVIKVFTSLYESDAPVKYRIRAESVDASLGGESGPKNGSPGVNPKASSNGRHNRDTSGRKTTPVRHRTNTASSGTCGNQCTQKYDQCIRTAILRRTGTGACIVSLSYCLKNCKAPPAAKEGGNRSRP